MTFIHLPLMFRPFGVLVRAILLDKCSSSGYSWINFNFFWIAPLSTSRIKFWYESHRFGALALSSAREAEARVEDEMTNWQVMDLELRLAKCLGARWDGGRGAAGWMRRRQRQTRCCGDATAMRQMEERRRGRHGRTRYWPSGRWLVEAPHFH